MVKTMLYVLCGIPASGKSTLGRYLLKEKNTILHSYDSLSGANTTLEISKAVMEQMYEKIKCDLLSGKNVICDTLMIVKEKRIRLLNYLKDINCEKICIVLQTPLEECLRRNTNREVSLPEFILIHSNSIFEYPSYNEGWDKIIVVN